MSFRSLLIAVTLTCPLATASAQESPRLGEPRYFSVTVFAGSSGYDLQGVGRAGSGGVRLAVGLTPSLLVEPSMSWFGYRGQYGDDIGYTMAELSVQLQAPTGALRPYIGAGIGYAFVRAGPEQNERTVHGSLGLRAQVVRHFGLMTEARIRNLSWFRANETVLDAVGGISITP